MKRDFGHIERQLAARSDVGSIASPDGYGRRDANDDASFPAEQAATDAARAERRRQEEARHAPRQAALEAEWESAQRLADSDLREVREIGPDGDWKWVPVSMWRHRDSARVMVGQPSDDFGAAECMVAKTAEAGFAWMVR